MSRYLSEEKKKEISIKITNQAWFKFNHYLNQGLPWNDAREHALALAATEKQQYDNDFVEDESDPEKSRILWEIRMDQFDLYISILKAIPENVSESVLPGR